VTLATVPGVVEIAYSGVREMTSERPSQSSQGQQAVQVYRIGAGHLHDLRAARRSRDQRDSATADAKRGRDRAQRRLGGAAVHGRRADPDDQRAIVFAAHARAR